MPLRPKTVTTKAYKPTSSVGNNLGGKFTPSGFVPNKPTVVAAPDQAPYKHGQSPTQVAAAAAAASGAIKIAARKHAATLATQRMLRAHGFKIAVDGQWGAQTDAAYRSYLHDAYQKRQQTKSLDASTSPLYVAPQTPENEPHFVAPHERPPTLSAGTKSMSFDQRVFARGHAIAAWVAQTPGAEKLPHWAQVQIYDKTHQSSDSGLQTLLGAPAEGQTPEESQASLEQFRNEQTTLPGRILESGAQSLVHPVTDLASGRVHSVEGAVSDVGQIAANFAPLGKAAAVFGLGGKALLDSVRGEQDVANAVRVAKDIGENAKNGAGATLNADLTAANDVNDAHMVALGAHEEQIKGVPTAEQIQSFRDRNADVLAHDPKLKVGIWHQDGTTYLDISKPVAAEGDALKTARSEGQLAVHRMSDHTDINTGLNEKQANSIKDDLKNRRAIALTDPEIQSISRSIDELRATGDPQHAGAADTLSEIRDARLSAKAGTTAEEHFAQTVGDNPLFQEIKQAQLPDEAHLAENPRDRYIPIFIDHEGNVVVGEPGMDHAAIDPKGNTYESHGYAVVMDGKVEKVNFSDANASEGAASLDTNPEVQAKVKAAVEAKFGGAAQEAAPAAPLAAPSHWSEDAVKTADEHGVDIADVRGTGEGGRVTQADVQRHAFEQMKPEDQLRSLFKGLRVQRGKQEVGYSEARRATAAKLRDIHASDMSPEEKRVAAAAAKQGELPKIVIGGHAREMNQDSLEHLMQTVYHHPNLMPYQKDNVVEALHKLITTGTVPTRRELDLMRHVWGSDTVGSLQEIATNWKKYGNIMLSAMNIPRSIMSSMDVSFGLRQALVAGFYDPKTWYKAWKAQFAYLSKYTGGGEEAYQALIRDIHASPNFPLYQEMGLSITDMEAELGLREEAYQSNLAEKATFKGHGPGNLIRGSGRAYTGMAVKLRTELADKMLVQAAAAGRDVHDSALLKEMGHFINGITGRGDLPGKVLQESAPLLNSLFFSPRLLASRLQMLNPKNYVMGDAFVRRQYLRAGLRTFGALATLLGTIKMFVPGAVVGTDWRSSDFGKIKIGHSRIDLGGGFNQLFHLMGMIYTGQKVSSSNGRVSSLTSNRFGQATRADAFVNFLSGKLAPTPSMINDWAKNKDPQHPGQPFNWKDEAASHFQPLIAQDAWNLYNDPVHGLNGIEAAAAGYGLEATGIGLQTYGPSVPGKDTIKQYEEWASKTGVKIPPEVKQQMLHSSYLKSITVAHPHDPSGAMKEMIAYYTKTTGRHDLDRYLSVGNEGMQKRVMTAIRARMAGSASRYESAIKFRAKAKGLTK